MNGTLWFILSQLLYVLIAGLIFFLLGWLLRGKRSSVVINDLKDEISRLKKKLKGCESDLSDCQKSSGAKDELENAQFALKECSAKREQLENDLDATKLALAECSEKEESEPLNEGEELINLRVERDSYKNQLETLTETIAESSKFQSGELETDDLTKIKGVAKVLNGKLNSYGIYTYKQIFEWEESDRQAFDQLLSFSGRIDRDEWQKQAREFHREKYGN